MTIAGLQIFNDSNVIQIDQNYKNMMLLAKGTGSTSPDGEWTIGPSTIYTYAFTITAVSPVLAVRSTGTSPVCVSRASNSGTSWTYRISHPGIASQDIDYYVFDASDQITTSDTFGLEVFDASGNRTFHSSLKALKVVGLLHADVPPITENFAGSNSATYPGGRTYAAIQCNTFQKNYDEPSEVDHGPLPPGQSWYDSYNWRGAFKFTGTTLEIEGAQFEEFFYSATHIGPTAQYGQMDWLVVDVTNY